ncbi:autophagocytosis associated protein, active-site domain-containing protein [Ditylenchus destructor]|uniref:Ubiquitin-like-conjugating enzyme ATG10 n=1 Tax=Ditylenchus destructor TaxID=166010 RepID=A0AAD4MKA3_9BILA|nr:autophagocytosis associated protein, active-site domain-containing protein [Ditylenchus destructor]
MISEQRFLRDIKEISLLTVRHKPQETWSVKESPGLGTYLECQPTVVEIGDDGRQALRCANITYSQSYSVPILWFNFYSPEGKLLLLDDFRDFLSKSAISSTQVLDGISQNEHPILGVAFYNLHPCKTADLMKELREPRNYVLSFLSILGSFVDLQAWPVEMFADEIIDGKS